MMEVKGRETRDRGETGNGQPAQLGIMCRHPQTGLWEIVLFSCLVVSEPPYKAENCGL